LLGVSFVTSLKSNLCTALTTQKTAENICITSHAQNTTALLLNVFLTGIHRLLVTNKGGLAFHSENRFQGQMQSPQFVSVFISFSLPATQLSLRLPLFDQFINSSLCTYSCQDILLRKSHSGAPDGVVKTR
jgi:hypothetical protein